MSTAALRLSIKQWAPEDRPTDRLQRLGTDSLTDAELLAHWARHVSTNWRTLKV